MYDDDDRDPGPDTSTDAGECCDDCGALGAADYGHAILCAGCAEEAGDPGPSDYACRRAEAAQMGLCDR